MSDSVCVYGVFVEIFGQGVLLTGQPGVGKSETALALIDRGSYLISDDMVTFKFSSCGKKIVGACSSQEFKGFLEVRGLGVIEMNRLLGAEVLKTEAPLDLVCELVSFSAMSMINRTKGVKSQEKILGRFIPKIILPISPERNKALLVETIVKIHLQDLSSQSIST